MKNCIRRITAFRRLRVTGLKKGLSVQQLSFNKLKVLISTDTSALSRDLFKLHLELERWLLGRTLALQA